MRNNKGFTLIELIVVIAIIAILAAIVIISVNRYIGKAKVARANADTKNIEKALDLFYAQYGEYPISGGAKICTMAAGFGCDTDNPFLTVGGTDYYFSEFYKSDWIGYNANYFAKNGFYCIELFDSDHDGKIGCITVALYSVDGGLTYGYGNKSILCEDCACNNVDFQTSSIIPGGWH